MLPTPNSNHEKILIALYNKLNGNSYSLPSAISTSEKILAEIVKSEISVGGGGGGPSEPYDHTHPISDVEGLQNILNNIGPYDHTHRIADINGLQVLLDKIGEPYDHLHQVSDIEGLQALLDSVFTQSSNGKKLLEDAIKNKGVIVERVAPIPTYQELKSGIDKIERGEGGGGGGELVPLVQDFIVSVISDPHAPFLFTEHIVFDDNIIERFTITLK